MKFIPLIAAFHLLSVFSAIGQMWRTQTAKPGGISSIQIMAQPGDVAVSEDFYLISEQGNLKLPQLKQGIPAAGIRFESLVHRINEAFAAIALRPLPSVKRILQIAACPAYSLKVGGSGKTPSEIALRQGMTLMAAIDKAGGFSKTADPSLVKLIRGQKETIYDLSKINPDGSNNPLLMDGDEIVVPASPVVPGWPGLLKPGDGVPLLLRGAGEPEITTVYQISASGMMRLPLLEKEIDAAGVTAGALVLRINDSYRAAGIAVAVEVSKPEPMADGGFITVEGGVKSPAKYPRRQGMTMMAAINRAGGMLGRATKVKILRDKKEMFYDLRKLNPDGSNNPILVDGDVIVVPEP